MSHPARHHGQHHAVALQAQGLSACHGTQTVVDDVSLSARAGQWLAIVGPNGAGKSSLLRCLSGLMAPSLGSIALQGQPLARWPQRARARHLAWLGQEGAATDESISVLDTVALGRLPHQGWLGWPGQSTSDTRAIDQALRDTDMLWAAARPIKALSGGERQRVNLARALAVQADVLLLDEPVAHLDAPHQRLLAQVLQREATQGRCVISVLHELPLALLADQLAVMQSGRIVAQGHRDDPLVHRAIESVFDQAVSITRLNERWVLLPAL
jgi:iron complex transport system ATP-binding protein